MNRSALNPKEEAKKLLHLRGLAGGGWVRKSWPALWLREMAPGSPKYAFRSLGFTHILRHLGTASAWAKAIFH